MKSLHFLFVLLLPMTFISCLKDKCTEHRTYTYFKPVYVTPAEYQIPVKMSASTDLKNPGKIYFYQNYIFINELRKGLHIINNEDPRNPINEGFIEIPGNVDIAIRNNILYVDGYTDLLAINISNIKNPTLVERKQGVFNDHYFAQGTNIYLSHYEETPITQTIDCSDKNYNKSFFMMENGGVFFSANNSIDATSFSSNADGSPQIGQGGSMARFTISKNHLFAIGNTQLYSLPILSSGQVGESSSTTLPWGIETIFPYKDYLFVGANDGLYIVDITTPLSPQLRSSFTHARACDPVIVKDDIAFVTLRTNGNICPGDRNELQVLDVKDVLSPKLLYSFPMKNPHGLAGFGDHLYICEGESGMKIFDKSNLSLIGSRQLAHLINFMAYDVIAVKENLLLLIGNDGFYQFDCSDPNNIIWLSNIKTQ
ncbi:MAG: hypothetical protein WAT79_15525 [Saprospiraceae bacterium]